MFKESFKYYKTKKEEITLDNVYDLHFKGINLNVSLLENEILFFNFNN